MISRMLYSLYLLGTLSTAPILSAEALEPCQFAYITGGLSPLNLRDLHLGYDFLIKRYAKNYNLNITMLYDENGAATTKGFQTGEIAYVGMTFMQAAKFYPALESSIGDIYISSSSNTLLEQNIALVRRSDPNDLKWFAGKRAVTQEGMSNAIMQIDTLSMEFLHKRYKDSFKMDYVETSNRAILKLFFNQADIAFVPLRTWETAKTMNPALEDSLKIINTSAPIFGYGIEIFSNKLTDRSKQISKQANSEMEQLEDGRQLMRIMKATKREKITKEQLKMFLKPYVQYLQQTKAFEGNTQ